ncbi:hypothetical protein FIBSPDRAFT_965922 [Athelia psychrophila]|uniref:Uncharacterized protein n=1 Tax=Athelia psychrophila TaxID=1759441 RepID=A0A167XD41_9AGAM|nr:hypothetical protein FIBSPDRAFT_965922 [Fibularhizoctonia sp. CBS 109695]
MPAGYFADSIKIAADDSSPTSWGSQTKLPHFITYALYLTTLHTELSATLVMVHSKATTIPTSPGA